MLRTPRLTMERPSPRHLPGFLAFYASPRAAARGWQRSPDQAKDFWAVLDKHWDTRGFGWFALVVTDSDTPIGMCGPWAPEHLPEGELAWSLWFDDAEGQGLAFEAAMAAKIHTFGALGWPTAVSYIAADNTRTIALAERLGAIRDDAAERPAKAPLVYRHPAPEVLQ